MPNLVYTSGTQWRLYRDEELLAAAALEGDLAAVGTSLRAGPEFEGLLTNFLR